MASVALLLLLVGGLAVFPTLAVAEEHTVAEPDADRVHIDIRVDEDGDAVWQVSYRIELPTDADRAAFDDLADDIETDPEPYAGSYHDRMTSAATTAEAATNREMAIDGMTVGTETTELPEPTGVVVYEFRWANFAVDDGASVTVGDSIDRLFLDGETSLLIGGPDGWAVQSASPAPTDERSDAAVWRGPYEFGENEPRVTLAPADDSMFATISFPMVLVGAVLFALVGAGVFVGLRSRSGAIDSRDDSPKPDEGIVDPELLSNEEQVIQVLKAHGGRLKQKELAEELDWTAAKTSQVTTELREEGRIGGFRLGRENVLKLPEEEPTDR